MEVDSAAYIINKLDSIDVLQVLKDLRIAFRKGLLDRGRDEHEYKQKVIRKLDVSHFIKERNQVYAEYDNYCDRIVPLLVQLENMNSRERILMGANSMIDLFYLDGKRRQIGGVYNDPDSIGRRAESHLREAMDNHGISKDNQESIFRTILLPNLPYDIQFQKDVWQFFITKEIRCEEDILQEGQELANLYTRGSRYTLLRKLKPMISQSSLAKKFLERMNNAHAYNLNKKEEVDSVFNKKDDETLQNSLADFKILAYFNCVEDLKRRSCIDRFEEYLLRKFVGEALFEESLISTKDPFSIPQDILCNIAQKAGASNGIH